MTPDMHPNWDSTDNEEQSVPVHITPEAPQEPAKEPTPAPPPSQPIQVSRQPAALAGILLVVAVGFTFYKGVESLRGQLTDTVEIRMTNFGFEPDTVQVDYGMTITWINDTNEPQTITSDEICADDGTEDCLNLGPIAPGSSATYTVSDDMYEDIYSYTRLSDRVIGDIIVGSAGEFFGELDAMAEEEGFEEAIVSNEEAPAPTGLQELQNMQGTMEDEEDLDAMEEQADTVPTIPEPDFFTDLPAAPTEVPATPEKTELDIPTTPAAIPTNPYTIGSPGVPSANVHSGAPAPITQHNPIRQPETGAGIWMVALLSLVGIYLIAKNSVRRVYVRNH